MPLRLLELTVPHGKGNRVPELLKDIPIIHLWTAESEKTAALVRILVDASHVESSSDALVGYFGSREGFRLTVLSVEATLPAVQETAENEVEAQEGANADQAEPQRISREELYEDLAQGSNVTRTYMVMVALSAVVAAVGLIRGNVAIIIGAMVIAPLLGPNIALSLACTLGDPGLAKRSLKAVGVGVAITAALSTLLGVVLEIDPSAPELAARTRADVTDVILALSAGAAGTLAFTSGVPAVVVGVMVAVALLPPLVVLGLLAGAGYGMLAMRALMLLLTNVTCVNLAAVATFLLQKVRPRSWWEEDRAKRATRVAVTIWVLMLLVLLGLMLLGHLGAV